MQSALVLRLLAVVSVTTTGPRTVRIAVCQILSIDGDRRDRIAALARKYDLMISIGLDEKDGDRLYDSAILVDKSTAPRTKRLCLTPVHD